MAVTLDLHAMVTPAMVEHAQILVSYKTYPHIDMRETGRHAGKLLDAAMRGAIRPRTLRAHRPALQALERMATAPGLSPEWVRKIRERMARLANYGDAR